MQGIVKIINVCKVIMIKRFSFAGASVAAIAFAVLCPSPARALSFNWTFTSNAGNFIGPVSGTIDGLIDNSLNNISNNPGMTATVTSNPFSIAGAPSQMTLNTSTSPPGGNGIRVTAGVVDTNGLQLYFTSGDGFKILQLEKPNGFYGGYYFDQLASGFGSTAISDNGSVPVFTAVPAPLPLLGLGAATAFSRKLKQRIALRRKREEVGAAV